MADWTSEEIDRLRAGWAAGKSSTQICAELKAVFGTARSRNAIIGKVHRLGLEQRIDAQMEARLRLASVKSKRLAKATDGVHKTVRHKPKGVFVMGNGPRTPPVPVAEVVAQAQAPMHGLEMRHLPLLELKNEQCRFPTSLEGEPLLFCGADTNKHPSWCDVHLKRVISPYVFVGGKLKLKKPPRPAP